jgi:hypothetical protein
VRGGGAGARAMRHGGAREAWRVGHVVQEAESGGSCGGSRGTGARSVGSVGWVQVIDLPVHHPR